MAIEIIGQCVRNVSEMSGKCSWKVLLVHPKSHRNFSWKVLLAHPKSEILMETGFHTMTAGPCLRALIGQRLWTHPDRRKGCEASVADEILTGKPHDKNGKMDGFQCRFSETNPCSYLFTMSRNAPHLTVIKKTQDWHSKHQKLVNWGFQIAISIQYPLKNKINLCFKTLELVHKFLLKFR